MSFIGIHAQKKQSMSQSIHQFTVTDIAGEPFNMASLKGKKVMIVNTASKCGLTPQYKNLQELYDQYNCENFEIIGFPANNFLWQESGSDDKIAAFCQKNYGVTFPMMSKISVRGRKMHPIYAFLTKKEQNGFKDSKVKWNFQKYLIDENGELVRIVGPSVLPDDPSIVDWIKS